MAGDLVDQKEITVACGPLVLSSGHNRFYKGLSLNKFYIKRLDLQEKIAAKKYFYEMGRQDCRNDWLFKSKQGVEGGELRGVREDGTGASGCYRADEGAYSLSQVPRPTAVRLTWPSSSGKHRQSRSPGPQRNLSGNSHTTRCCPKHRWGSLEPPSPGVCWSPG